VPHPNDQLRLNVGFLINQAVGTSRDFAFDIQNLHLEPDLDLLHLAGNARFTRTAQGFLVQVKLDASRLTECVRCISECTQSLRSNFTELYAFSSNSVTDTELILPETAQINLNPLVREYMLLEVPISTLCREDCKGLCPICGENRNEVMCHHEEDTSDPRLNILRTLLDEE